MSLSAKRDPIFETSVEAGQHQFVITDVKTFKKSNGEIYLQNGKPGIILSIRPNTEKFDSGLHQELFWIEGNKWAKFVKLMKEIGIEKEGEIEKKDFINKLFWGEIKEIRTVRGTETIKTEKRLNKTAPISQLNPFPEHDYIEYKQEQFHQDNDPAF